MARTPRSLPARNGDIFVNCPFDDAYLECFQALLFAVTYSGYQARCALEESNAGAIRFDKLCRLILDCDDSIHDLSRTETGMHGLPRFNMPFELGLMMGARQFGSRNQRRKRACIMVARDYVLPVYMSDLAGNDVASHGGNPREVIRIVRDHLHHSPVGNLLPGAERMAALHDQFLTDLPELARRVQLTTREVHARLGYRNFMEVLRVFCATVPGAT